MNYHIVRISPLVNLTLRYRIEKDEKLEGIDYSQMLRSIMDQHYTYADSFSFEMLKMGNRCDEILYDVERLQKTWAAENDVHLVEKEQWQFKIVAHQLQKLNPDIIYLQGFTRITAKDIAGIRSTLPNLKKIVVHSGFPGGLDKITEDTVVFCGIPSIQAFFAKHNVEAHLLYHAFDPRILNKLSDDNQKIDFTFVGSSGYGYGKGHKNRYWELLKLSHNSPLILRLDERAQSDGILNPFVERPFKDRFYSLDDDDWNAYPDPPAPLSYFVPNEKCGQPLYGIPFYQFLTDSRVTLHRHTNEANDEVGAMRLFQATGVGSCLLTDSGTNMTDLFEPDTEVVTYGSVAECADKAAYLLDNPNVAKEIAQAGQNRILKDHTTANRYRQIDEYLKSILR